MGGPSMKAGVQSSLRGGERGKGRGGKREGQSAN